MERFAVVNQFSMPADYTLDVLTGENWIARESAAVLRLFVPGDEYLNSYLDFSLNNGGRRDPEALFVMSGDPYRRDTWIIETAVDYLIEKLSNRIPWLWCLFRYTPHSFLDEIIKELSCSIASDFLDNGNDLSKSENLVDYFSKIQSVKNVGRICRQWDRRVSQMGMDPENRNEKFLLPQSKQNFTIDVSSIFKYFDLPRHKADEIRLRNTYSGNRRVREIRNDFELRSKREIKQFTKAALRSIELAKNVFGVATTEALIRGAQVVIGRGRFEYRVSIKSVISQGHGGFELELYEVNTDEKLARACIYVSDTPTLDQIVAFKMLIDSGEEDRIVKKANLTKTDYCLTKSEEYPDLKEVKIRHPINFHEMYEWNKDNFEIAKKYSLDPENHKIVKESIFKSSYELEKPDLLDFNPSKIKIDYSYIDSLAVNNSTYENISTQRRIL